MSIALSLGNNLTTNGVFKPAAVNNTSVNNVTTFASVPAGGALFLLSTQTASSSASISFTSGIDSTYDSYVFKFINCHAATNSAKLVFNLSTDSGSNYNVTKTSTTFVAYHNEAGTSAVLEYAASEDLAQSTSDQIISTNVKNDADIGISGNLQIFQPSSNIFVKHYIARTNGMNVNTYSMDFFTAGYGNTTSAIDAVQFKMSSGNIDDGIIKMYGVK